MFKLLNVARVKAGLPPLVRDARLDTMAEDNAVRMATGGPQDTAPDLSTNAWWEDYKGGTPRLDSQTAQTQIDYTLKSPDFKDAMLRPEGRATGVAVVVSGSRVNYTMVFDVINTDVTLYENSAAKDPTWAQLVDFLQKDDTDQQQYIVDEFVCRHFAARLHNNAERAGIKAAYVSIAFADDPVGHAMNAFNTTDRGLVYVDDTPSTNIREEDKALNADKVAYIELGQRYGIVALQVAKGFNYSDYETYKESRQSYDARMVAYEQSMADYDTQLDVYNKAVQDHNLKVAAYNAAPSDVVYQQLTAENKQLEDAKIGLNVLKDKLDAMRTQLDALSADLGSLYQPMSVVGHFYVHF